MTTTWTRSLLHAIDPVTWAHDRLGFHAEDWQVPILRSRADRLALNVSRQGGKSSLSAIVATHRATFHPGSVAMVASSSLRQSSEVMRKVRAFLLSLGAELVSDSASELELHNGSRLVIAPASGEGATARGFSLDLLIVDEAARVQDEAIAALRPMLAARPDARLLFLSTPAGQRGDFHRACTDAALGFDVHTVPASQIAHITPAFLESERLALGPRAFAAEYECVFGETEAALFDLPTLQACLSPDLRPLFHIQTHRLEGALDVRVTPLPLSAA